MTTTTRTRTCPQLLYGDDGPEARCTEPWGTEHDHSDATPAEHIARGTARPLAGAEPPDDHKPDCTCRVCWTYWQAVG